ncbi:MAG TPA: hypothetical protein VF432_01780 [Thermoanaerobaculia bacterium]
MRFTRALAIFLALTTSLFFLACDSPKENATEERVEDKGEAAGQSEDAAEARGEAVSEGQATDTISTDTMATTATVTETSATTATTGT